MKIFLTLLLSIPLFGIGQELFSTIKYDSVDNTKPAGYEQVTEISETKIVLFNKAKVWFAEAFKNSNYVVQMEDKEEGTIVGKGTLPFTYVLYTDKKKKPIPTYEMEARADFTIKVFCKDGKFKYIISDIVIKGGSIDDEVSSIHVVLAKRSDVKELKEAYDFTQVSKYRAFDNGFKNITNSLILKMKAKSETDF